MHTNQTVQSQIMRRGQDSGEEAPWQQAQGGKADGGVARWRLSPSCVTNTCEQCQEGVHATRRENGPSIRHVCVGGLRGGEARRKNHVSQGGQT